MKIINGTELANSMTGELRERISSLNKEVSLGIIQVGENEASTKYVAFKVKKAEELGIVPFVYKIPEGTSEKSLIKTLQVIATEVDGLIIQLPLPEGFNKELLLNSIPVDKDIDGLHSENTFTTPATPRGIMTILKSEGVDFASSKFAVVGQSDLVGKPLADIIEAKGSTVSRHDLSTGLKGTEVADVVIVAAGSPNLIKAENIKEGVVLINVGINAIDEDGKTKLVGDVDMDSIGTKPSKVTNVTGGVGPMTIISLFKNLLDLIENNN